MYSRVYARGVGGVVNVVYIDKYRVFGFSGVVDRVVSAPRGVVYRQNDSKAAIPPAALHGVAFTQRGAAYVEQVQRFNAALAQWRGMT